MICPAVSERKQVWDLEGRPISTLTNPLSGKVDRYMAPYYAVICRKMDHGPVNWEIMKLGGGGGIFLQKGSHLQKVPLSPALKKSHKFSQAILVFHKYPPPLSFKVLPIGLWIPWVKCTIPCNGWMQTISVARAEQPMHRAFTHSSITRVAGTQGGYVRCIKYRLWKIERTSINYAILGKPKSYKKDSNIRILGCPCVGVF